MSLKKFVTHYSSELAALTGIIRNLLPGVPINAHDRDKVLVALAALDGSVNSITEGLDELSDDASAGNVTVRRSDVDDAVGDVLPDMVAAEVARQLSAIAANRADPETARTSLAEPAPGFVTGSGGADTSHLSGDDERPIGTEGSELQRPRGEGQEGQ